MDDFKAFFKALFHGFSVKEKPIASIFINEKCSFISFLRLAQADSNN
jgi:hypothetical protein